jgi:ABC-type Zn uptake system ZnuABC Zn-binding protein ZnuA
VAGDDAQVQVLLDSTGVHDYHPTTHDSLRLHGANLLIINGLNLDEEFTKTLAANANNPSLKIVEVGEAEALKDQLIKMKKGGRADDGHGHKHGENDPHIWLGIPEAIVMVEVIRDAMIAADPEHKQGYETRAKDYIKTLNDTLEAGRKELKGKKDKKVVTFHDSLAYFARAFDLQVLGTIQPSAGEDAPARRMADLVDRCKKEGVRVVIAEPGVRANTEADTLVAELQKKDMKDAVKIEVDMLESAPRSALTKDYYTDKMKQNLETLAKNLK